HIQFWGFPANILRVYKIVIDFVMAGQGREITLDAEDPGSALPVIARMKAERQAAWPKIMYLICTNAICNHRAATVEAEAPCFGLRPSAPNLTAKIKAATLTRRRRWRWP